IVAIDASSRATCDSSAIVTLSRNRRVTRVLTVRRNHVAVTDTPRPIVAISTSRGRWPSTPSPSSLSQTAISASGSAESSDSRNATDISAGSCWYPSLHSRHIDGMAGGSGSSGGRSGEDVILLALLVFRRVEPLRLQVEHGLIPAAARHQLVLRPEHHDTALLEYAYSIGVAHGGEAMRDEDGRAVAGCGENPLEDLGFTADVELRRRLVQQHDPGAELDGAHRARERDALPLSARQLGSAGVAARQHGIEGGEVGGARR